MAILSHERIEGKNMIGSPVLERPLKSTNPMDRVGGNRRIGVWLVKYVFALFVAFHAAVSGVSAAERKLKPGIIGEDNREMIGETPGPWTAIGHINVSGYRSSERCTGTRIAPGIVLTSAHCVINFTRKMMHPAKDIHFVAGVNRDTSVGHATARCVILPKDLVMADGSRVLPDLRTVQLSEAFLMRDMALVILIEDVPAAGAIALSTEPLSSGQQLFHAGYPADRRQVLTVDRTCRVTGKYRDLVVTDCDTVSGSSGGPILVNQKGEWHVAAIMAATTNGSGNLAVPLSIWTNILKEGQCPEE
jgi:protease YdgD